MNLDELQTKLIAVARAQQPSVSVPYAFERRITARLKSLAAVDYWALWGHALWRAVAPCVAITLLLAAWSLFNTSGKPARANLSQDFDNTVLAATGLDQSALDSVQ